MKKLLLANAVVAAVSTFGAVSVASAEVTTSANVGVFTDYKFRGISQTNGDFALQGGFDVDFGNGFYIGNWNSNVSFAPNNLEMDFYGGYAGETAGGIGYDVGLLYYYYPNFPNAPGAADADTLELYGSVSFGGFTAGLSYALSDDYFALTAANGSTDLSGSTYFKLGYELPLSDNLSLAAHYGMTSFDKDLAVAGGTISRYSDYAVGATYTMGKYAFGANIVGVDKKGERFGGRDQVTDTSLILSVSTSF